MDKRKLLNWYHRMPQENIPEYVKVSDVNKTQLLIDGRWQNKTYAWGLFKKNGLWIYVDTDRKNGRVVHRREFSDEHSASSYAKGILKREVKLNDPFRVSVRYAMTKHRYPPKEAAFMIRQIYSDSEVFDEFYQYVKEKNSINQNSETEKLEVYSYTAERIMHEMYHSIIEAYICMANLRKETQNKKELLEWFRYAPMKGLPQYVEGTEDEILAGGGWKERKAAWGIFEKQSLWYYIETDAATGAVVIRKEFTDEKSAVAYARENLERKIKEVGERIIPQEAQQEKSQPCPCSDLGQKELLEKQMEDKEKMLAAIEGFMADLEKKYSELDSHIEELEKQRREILANKVKAEIDAETANQKVLMISDELGKIYREKKDAHSNSGWMKRKKKQVLDEIDRIRQEYESLDAKI